MSALHVTAFVSGFALMAYELVAARILAPYIGSSTYVWTSVIGLIIAAMSLGYWVGGRLADRRQSSLDVVGLLLASAVAVIWTLLVYDGVLEGVVRALDDPRWQAVAASLLLFVPASFALGVLSPYLVKLNVTSLEHSGRSVASLSALNSVGGIVGTFLTGFVLFGYIGSRESLVVVVALLVACSWLLVPGRLLGVRLGLTGLCLLLALVGLPTDERVVEVDTPSARYSIYRAQYAGESTVLLATGPRGAQSGVYAAPERQHELVFWYTREIARLIEARAPESVLVLGGGAFTLPQYLATALPEATIDAVEIDPELERLSTEYFGYTAPESVELIFEDARTYVERTSRRYDVVVVDVFSDTSVPFHLMSREYGAALGRIVRPGGVVIANTIAGMQGGCRSLMDAIHGAYVREFPYASGSHDPRIEPMARGNRIIVYSRTPLTMDGLRPMDLSGARSYTDNYMPAEALMQGCQST